MPEARWRDGPPEHFTASMFLLDAEHRRIALNRHRKARAWMQFGGHVEHSDSSFAAAALREGAEESGIADLGLIVPRPVQLHRHALPASFGRCRAHWDVVFAAAPRDPAAVLGVSDESDDVAWFPVDDLPSGVVADLPARLAELTAALERQSTGSGPGPSGAPASDPAPSTSTA